MFAAAIVAATSVLHAGRAPSPVSSAVVAGGVGSHTSSFGRELAFMGTQTFFSVDEKDGRVCGAHGEICRCFGHAQYGNMFSWSEKVEVDGSIMCIAASFGGLPAGRAGWCRCYPTICTSDIGSCTPRPCSCPSSKDPATEWAKKTLSTGEGVKCWACERRATSAGVLEEEAPFCPTLAGRCSLNRRCTCESRAETKRVIRTRDGRPCWTCAAQEEQTASGMDGGQKAMFWMLPLLWPFMDFPRSAVEVFFGCTALSTFLVLCFVGYLLQHFVAVLNLNRFFSFYAPCMKKGELWRLFTYFMLHSDMQHLCINAMHLLDALDLEGVPNLEVSLGVPLRCTRDGPVSSVCYPDVGIGRAHVVALIALVLAYGALVGTIRSFGALVQGASSVCFGVDGALVALYSMFLGAGLDAELKIPEFGMFFWMRIGIIAFHIFIDIVQSLCGSGKDSVGTTAHMASFFAGFCYVVLVLPPLGDGLFDDARPYIVECGATSAVYTALERAASPCLAFFSRSAGVELVVAQRAAAAVLAAGVVASLVGLVMRRHVGDDGMACCATAPGNEAEEALLKLRGRRIAMLRGEAARLEGLLRSMGSGARKN